MSHLVATLLTQLVREQEEYQRARGAHYKLTSCFAAAYPIELRLHDLCCADEFNVLCCDMLT